MNRESEPGATPDPERRDPLDRWTDELLSDPELFDAGPSEEDSDSTGSSSDEEADEAGGLTWIRATLRTGGDADDALVGTLFHDKYRILRKIGAGGFGAVYEAVDERGAHNRVALKIMLQSPLHANSALEVFRGEAVRVTRLNHPNIVAWKSFDRTPDGSYYFVMELLEGEDLQTVIKREGRFEWRRTVQLLLQIFGALRAAHFVGEGQSILHLDLKPKNVLLLPERRSRAETVKVIDFGIGQYLGGEELEPAQPIDKSAPRPIPAVGPKDFSTVTTRTDPARAFEQRAARYPFHISQACTPEYASPEHCAHIQFADGADIEPQPLDGRADIYSVGVIAYQLLTGRLPFSKPAHRFQYLELHRAHPIEPWGDEERQIPAILRRFVERCLEKDPHDRWQDAQAAHEALERIARPALWRRLLVPAIALVLVGVALTKFLSPAERLVALVEASSTSEHALEAAYLGPAASSLRLREVDEGRGLALSRRTGLLLVDAADQLLTDWSVSGLDEQQVFSIAPTEEFIATHPGRLEIPGVRLRDEAALVHSKTALRLVWLGPDSHAVELVCADRKFAIDEGALAEPLVLDPTGLLLEWQFAELRAGDLDPERTSWRCGERELPLELRERRTGVAVVCSLDGLSDGPHQAQFVAHDRAGLETRVSFLIVARSTGPALEVFSAQAGTEEKVWIENTALVLGSGARVQLKLESPADVRLECAPLDLHANLRAGEALLLSLDDKIDLRTPFAQHEFEIQVADGVLAADDRRALHRPTRQLRVQVIESREVSFQLLPDGDREVREELSYGANDRVQLEARTFIPAKLLEVVVQVRRRDAPREVLEGPKSLVPDADHILRLSEQLTVLGPTRRDGDYELVAEAFELDSEGQRRTDHPIHNQSLAFRIDTLAPALKLADVQDAPRLVTATRSPFPIHMEDRAPNATGVHLHWSVQRDGKSVTPERIARARAASESATSPRWSVDPMEEASSREWPDGRYSLALWAVDGASNRQDLPSVDFELARFGPELVLVSPKDFVGAFGRWSKQGEQLLPIVALALDENGVARQECSVRRSTERLSTRERPPLAASHVRLRFDAQVSADAQRKDVRTFWSFAPDETWSEADDVYLCFEASDKHGATSFMNVGPFHLPVVVEPRPARVDGMWLVPGNAEEPYVFKGRNPEDENQCFDAVDLPAIWVPSGQAKAGQTESPWAIVVPAGELRPFYLDEQKVTIGEFLRFLEDGDNGYVQTANWVIGARPSLSRRDRLQRVLRSLDPMQTVADIQFCEAHAYATAHGKRLPSLLELEFAARAGTNYRAWSWDARDADKRDDSDPWRRVRGLSSEAEWSSSPATFAATSSLAGGPLSGPNVPPSTFLPLATAILREAEEVWIRGSLAGSGATTDQSLRHDFAAIDAAPISGWTDARVGFRCARSVDASANSTQDSRRSEP